MLYNNGASLTIKTGGSVTVKGNLTTGATSTISNSGSLNVSGNTVNNGTISAPAASTLRFQGSSAQTLSGTSPVNAMDVIVDNAAGVTLTTTLNVDGAMTFTNGIITATNSSYPIVFSANASVANTPTDASHIDGYVKLNGTGPFTFPVGDATKYQPVGVNLSANNSGMTARYYSSDPGSAPFGTGGSSSTALVAVNRAEYWELSPSSTATGTVTIYFDGYKNSGISSTTDLRVAHKSGGQWLNEGGTATGTTSAGSVTSNTISTFSPFTLGSVSASSPLPVTLVSFSGKIEGDANRLDWQTAVEDGNTNFIVERSGSGSSFDAIGSVMAKGSNSQYAFIDRQPLSGVAYYRLRTIETSGATTYSQTVILRRVGNGSGQIAIYPVPTTSELTINSIGSNLEGTSATVTDAQEKSVATILLSGVQRIDVHSWPAGMYMLRFADGSTQKLIKQ